MSKRYSISPAPTARETVSGLVYLALQLFVLPSLLHWVNAQLSHPLGTAELNFVFYLVNFIMMLLIFHEYLGRNLKQVGQHPLVFCEAVILGLAAYYALSYLTTLLIGLLAPGFSNYNDEAIAAMSRTNSFVMIIGTVILVPPFEECIYRGLIFRNLYGKNRLLAFGDSITQGVDVVHPSLAYAPTLARLMDADSRNKGIGGEVFFPALLEEKEDLDPDFVTVAYGSNDWSKCT